MTRKRLRTTTNSRTKKKSKYLTNQHTNNYFRIKRKNFFSETLHKAPRIFINNFNVFLLSQSLLLLSFLFFLFVSILIPLKMFKSNAPHRNFLKRIFLLIAKIPKLIKSVFSHLISENVCFRIDLKQDTN